MWFGPRGSDAAPLLQFSQFRDCFSLTSPVRSVENEVCLEALLQARRETNTFDVDTDPTPEYAELRAHLKQACDAPSVLLPYRASGFLMSAVYPRLASVEYLGLGFEQYSMFGHKAWGETQLRSAGIKVMPWTYIADENGSAVLEALERGPVVLRRNRTGGGLGLALVHDASQLEALMPEHKDGFVAMSPYLEGSIPLNVHGCVFPDGEVTLHAPSLQLIGIPECTTMPFGYCGNDFATVRDLDSRMLDDFESLTRQVGRWLYRNNYKGAFGIDALIHEGEVYFTELNPRFQGSSASAAYLDEQLDLPDTYMDQMAAFLGATPRSRPSLRDMARSQPLFSQVTVHNELAAPVVQEAPAVASPRFDVGRLPLGEIRVEADAQIAMLTTTGRVTADGRHLFGAAAEAVHAVRHAFSAAAAAVETP